MIEGVWPNSTVERSAQGVHVILLRDGEHAISTGGPNNTIVRTPHNLIPQVLADVRHNMRKKEVDLAIAKPGEDLATLTKSFHVFDEEYLASEEKTRPVNVDQTTIPCN